MQKFLLEFGIWKFWRAPKLGSRGQLPGTGSPGQMRRMSISKIERISLALRAQHPEPPG
jgi:hypothetical protein